jgi:hypothetical protein
VKGRSAGGGWVVCEENRISVVVRGISCKSAEARGKTPPLYDRSCVGRSRSDQPPRARGRGGGRKRRGVYGRGGVWRIGSREWGWGP